MKKRLLLTLCLVWLTSGTFAAVQPIGSLGEGILRQAHFLPDGTVLRVMTDRIEIVDPDTNEIIDKFAEGINTEEVNLSPNGAWLAVVTDSDGTRKSFIEIWEIATRKPIRRLESEWPSAVAFSTAAPLLAVAFGDKVHLWNWEDNEYLGEMTDERRPKVSCHRSLGHCFLLPVSSSLTFSPEGNLLVVGSQRPDAEIWDVSTRKLVGHLEGHADWVAYVSYSPDGRFIATARPASSWVYFWDAQTQQRIRTLWTGGEGEIRKLLFSADSQRLYVATQTQNWAVAPDKRNDRIHVFDVQTGAQLNEFGDEFFILEDFSLSPDEKVALFRYYISEVVLWDIEHDRRLALWADYLSGYDWELSPDGRSLVMVNSAIMKIWDVPSRSLRQVIAPHSRTFRRFAISPDSQTIAIGQDPWIELRDIYTGEVTAQFDYHYGSTRIAFSQTGKRIAVQHFVFDIDNPEKREMLDELGYVFTVFSAQDTYLASTDGDRIHLWGQQDGKYVLRYTWHSPIGSGWPSTLAFLPSPDESPVLATGSFEEVNVWRIGDELEQVLTLDAMGPVHFSENGQYLFCNSEEELQIWDWREKNRIQHPSIPEYLTISRDGSVLLTLDDETGRVLIWDGSSLLPSEPVVPYDVNRDGVVDILDLVQIASQFGQVGTHLSGDVNGNGKVEVLDLVLVGSHLRESAAAPSLRFNRSDPIVHYHSSSINRQFQALTALESLENLSRGAHIARDLLKAWLAHVELSVTKTKLLPNYPNPFNPETWIPFQLANDADVRLKIYDSNGVLIRRLNLGYRPAGFYMDKTKAVYWDGRSETGERVASGVYFYQLHAGDFTSTRRMVILK